MILILGGTGDAIDIGSFLKDKGYSIQISTATSYGKELVRKHTLETFDSRLQGENMHRTLSEYNIKAVIDATHPYSTKVTCNAAKACQKLELPFVRFERPRTKIPDREGIYLVENFHQGAEMSFYLGKKILLTTGSKDLDVFIQGLNSFDETYRKTIKLYARVLPENDSIAKCQKLGLTPDQIIAIKGPLNYDLNKAIYKSYEISVVVTKDSGETGGTPEKIDAALDLGINIIIVKRPEYKEISAVTNKEAVLSWLQEVQV